MAGIGGMTQGTFRPWIETGDVSFPFTFLREEVSESRRRLGTGEEDNRATNYAADEYEPRTSRKRLDA